MRASEYLCKEGGHDEKVGEGRHHPHFEDFLAEEEGDVADDQKQEGRQVDVEHGVPVEAGQRHLDVCLAEGARVVVPQGHSTDLRGATRGCFSAKSSSLIYYHC